MNKEIYITPSTDEVAIKEEDVITTSPIRSSDELAGVTADMIDPSDPLYDLF